MPPSAMLSSALRVISVSPRLSRNSSVECGGNFGAPPKPPQTGSNCARRFETAAVSSPELSGSADAWRRVPRRSSAVIAAACVVTVSRRSRHTSAIAVNTCRKLGSPCRGSGG